MSNRVLVVDGDVRNLRVLEVSLRGAGFEVDTATTGLEAWDKLQVSPPDLVLSDTDLEGIDGFALCSRMRKDPRGGTVPILLLGSDQSLERKIRALEAGADDYLVKPALIKEVLARIRARLHRRERDRLISDSLGGNGTADSSAPGASAGAFTGNLAEITVVDLLQLVEAKGRSGIIHLRGDGGTPGAIYVRQGKVVDAEVGQLSGIDALSRLFAWTAGTFQVEWKSIRRKDAMERAPGAVIIEGLQRLDERNRLSATFSDPAVVFEVDYRLLAERLAEIPDEMNSVLRLCDGARTLEQILEDCPLPDVEALTALIRLRAEGIVFDRREDVPAHPSGAPGTPDGAAGGRASAASRVADGNREASSGEGSAAVRRRTAHGLGDADASSFPVVTQSPGSELSGPPSATSPTPVESRRDNLIQFPRSAGAIAHDSTGGVAAEADVVPSLLTDTLPPHLQALHRDLLNQHSASGEEDGSQMGSDEVSSSGPSDSAIPRSAGGASHTQRGFGAQMPSAAESSDTAVPREVVDRRSSGARETSGQYRTYDPSSRAADVDAPQAPTPATGGGVPGTLRSVEVTPSLGARTIELKATEDDATSPVGNSEESSGTRRNPGKVLAAGALDVTERIRNQDDEITPHDARDELGLPSRWRSVRFFAVALVVGALAAMVTHRLRAVSGGDHPAAPLAVGAPNGPGQGDTTADPPGTTGTPPPPASAAAAPGPTVDLPTPAAAAPVPTAPDEAVGPGAGAAAAIVPTGDPTPPAAAPEAPGAAVVAPKEPPAAPHGGPVVVPATAMPPVERQGPDPVQLLATCRTAFARNRQQEALSACAAAVAANPRSAEALTLLAHAELNRGRLSRAGELADRALALDPDIADAYVIAGGVHQDSGRNSEAKAAYRKYLELTPHGRYADELRSIVNSL